VVGLAIDIGLSAAEILLTGGTATLARQSAKLAGEAAERATARTTASALIEGASSAERAVLRSVARSGDAPSDVLRRAALLGEEALREKAPALLDRLVAEGMPVERAALQVETIISGTVARLRDVERISRLGNRGAAETISAARALDALGSNLPGTGGLPSAEVLREMLVDESKTKAVGNLRDLYKLYLSKNRNLPPEFQSALAEAGTAGDTAIAEAIETAFTIGVNTAQASASPGLSGMAKWSAKFGQGMTRNAGSIGLGVVSSAIEVAVAANYDRMINQEGKHFAILLGELEYLNDIYLVELAKDEKLAAIAARLASELAGADRRLAQLDGAFRQQPTVSSAGRAEGQVRIELAFSSPLAAAPTVRVGAQALTVRAAGADGRRWAGSLSGKTLGAGTHRLEVAIEAAASPHGALDTNLATPPMRAFGPQRWSGFEPGVDRAHAIRLDPAPPQLAASDVCPPGLPSGTPALACQCPALEAAGTVWGTYYYTDDSRLCLAAVHAGAIPASGGAISVHAAPGRDYYTASSANGVSSRSYGRWARSIIFDRVQSEESALGNVPICSGSFDGHTGAGGPPVCRCVTTASGSIWGSGPYTSDSSICRAALHAGVISSSGGIVRVTAAPGQKEYRGSTANGVTTSGWGSYPRSFTVSRGN
jgi:LCCL domain